MQRLLGKLTDWKTTIWQSSETYLHFD